MAARKQVVDSRKLSEKRELKDALDREVLAYRQSENEKAYDEKIKKLRYHETLQNQLSHNKGYDNFKIGSTTSKLNPRDPRQTQSEAPGNFRSEALPNQSHHFQDHQNDHPNTFNDQSPEPDQHPYQDYTQPQDQARPNDGAYRTDTTAEGGQYTQEELEYLRMRDEAYEQQMSRQQPMNPSANNESHPIDSGRHPPLASPNHGLGGVRQQENRSRIRNNPLIPDEQGASLETRAYDNSRTQLNRKQLEEKDLSTRDAYMNIRLKNGNYGAKFNIISGN
jgi:hypothetical protein